MLQAISLSLSISPIFLLLFLSLPIIHVRTGCGGGRGLSGRVALRDSSPESHLLRRYSRVFLSLELSTLPVTVRGCCLENWPDVMDVGLWWRARGYRWIGLEPASSRSCCCFFRQVFSIYKIISFVTIYFRYFIRNR
ncbi:hypothetical protein PanWU01x14_154180 [Parasponia andersonii]|uniref:Transmembrane protein n=1 Tax=Parasponia andersonii TaxID=3476 RepID=A0A2P5CGR8_PARAD|nr:hypothetical protein PanWU01x14_154180 [Parasponia andersonii]